VSTIIDPNAEQRQMEAMMAKLQAASQAQQNAAAVIGQFIMQSTVMFVAAHIQAYLTNPHTDHIALKPENMAKVIEECRYLSFSVLEELGKPPPKLEKTDAGLKFVVDEPPIVELEG
jgi:hypothetical protein